MLKYICKRLVGSVLTVIVIVSTVFLLLHLLPTDYYFSEEQLMKLTEEQKQDQLEAAGLLEPVGEQLLHYFGDLIHLDFGTSSRIQYGARVVDLISARCKVSVTIGCISLIISLIFGISMGIIQTLFKDRVLDYVGMAYTVFVNAVPGLVAFSLILMFGSRVLGLPSMYSTRNPVESGILPVACLSLGTIASYALWTRRYMVDELNKEYIKLAKIKGLSRKSIMVKHVLKNALVPLVQFIPNSVLLTLGGSLLVEKFFSVPGMGTLLADAIGKYDTNVAQTLVLLYSTLGVIGVFLGDVLMALIDPRIRLADKGEIR